MVLAEVRLRREGDAEPVKARAGHGGGRNGTVGRIGDGDVSGRKGASVNGLAEGDIQRGNCAGIIARRSVLHDARRHGVENQRVGEGVSWFAGCAIKVQVEGLAIGTEQARSEKEVVGAILRQWRESDLICAFGEFDDPCGGKQAHLAFNVDIREILRRNRQRVL